MRSLINYLPRYDGDCLTRVTRFGKIPTLWQFFEGKFSIWQNLYAIEQIFFDGNGQILKNNSRHLVTLCLTKHVKVLSNIYWCEIEFHDHSNVKMVKWFARYFGLRDTGSIPGAHLCTYCQYDEIKNYWVGLL